MKNADFLMAERICNVVGLPATLKICAFFGRPGARVYIPVEATPGHLLERLIGAEAFAALVAAEGGEAIQIPEIDLGPMKRAGAIYRLSKRGVPAVDIAAAVGLNLRTVQLIRQQQADMANLIFEGDAENG